VVEEDSPKIKKTLAAERKDDKKDILQRKIVV